MLDFLFNFLLRTMTPQYSLSSNFKRHYLLSAKDSCRAQGLLTTVLHLSSCSQLICQMPLSCLWQSPSRPSLSLQIWLGISQPDFFLWAPKPRAPFSPLSPGNVNVQCINTVLIYQRNLIPWERGLLHSRLGHVWRVSVSRGLACQCALWFSRWDRHVLTTFSFLKETFKVLLIFMCICVHMLGVWGACGGQNSV